MAPFSRAIRKVLQWRRSARAIRKVLQWRRSARAIRKDVPAALSAASQLPLLIRWRSVHSVVDMFIHASMIHMSITLWLNW